MSKQYTKLYVLMLNGVILTPDSFVEYWKNYGANGSGLHGWRPPKKIYYTLGHAKNGLRFVPEQIRDKVQIHVFESIEELSEINKLNNKIIDNLHRDMTVAENRGVKKGIEETEQKYKQFLDSLLDPDQYGHAVSPEVRDQVRILKGMKPVEGKSSKQTIRKTKEVPCPDCYGGHFRPCNICGDSGVANLLV